MRVYSRRFFKLEIKLFYIDNDIIAREIFSYNFYLSFFWLD